MYFLPAIRGSILGVNVIKIPKPLAALVRSVSLEVSARPLANVLCSCGKKGLTNCGILTSNLLSVKKIAAITAVSFNH